MAEVKTKCFDEAQMQKIALLKNAGAKVLTELSTAITDKPGQYKGTIAGTGSVRDIYSEKRKATYIVTEVPVKLESGNVVNCVVNTSYFVGDTVNVIVTEPNEQGYKNAKVI